MVGGKIVSKGRQILIGQQTSILSAASVIMVMIVAARVLGLVRLRILSQFFTSNDLSLFFAAFRLPDLVFEVLIFGAFSSAFIPVFTKALKDGERKAWGIAATATNIGLVLFVICAIIFALLARPLYMIIAPGYSSDQIDTIARLARILFAAQGFFVASYVLSGVLESLRRFSIPALAPLFYNLGIIVGTVLFAGKWGLMAPTIGVVIGAACHFFIQLPFAYRLGFRFKSSFGVTEEVKHIAKLSLPRIIDISFEQVAKTTELYLSSLISTASYAYLSLANSLQLLPVGLFGTSLAKAALPTLVRQAHSAKEFKSTLVTTINQIIFLVLPLSAVLVVLRIPMARLMFGSRIFDWEATVQTALAISAFGVGIVFQAVALMLERGFYALHDTKTPVSISLVVIAINIILDIFGVRVLHLPTWVLAAGFSISVICQTVILFELLGRKMNTSYWKDIFTPVVKSVIATLASSVVMFYLLKYFDRFSGIAKKNIGFERFILDTQYTFNLILLTVFVSVAGALVYVLISFIMQSSELLAFLAFIRKHKIVSPQKDSEAITPEVE